MSDSTFNLVSDSESGTSYVSRVGTYPNYHLPLLNHDHLKLEVIPLSNYFDLERIFRGSLEEETSSPDSLESLLSNVIREVNHNEVLIPLPT